MKTGNGHTPNPKKLFGDRFTADTSNVVKKTAPVQFSAKRDSKKKGK